MVSSDCMPLDRTQHEQHKRRHFILQKAVLSLCIFLSDASPRFCSRPSEGFAVCEIFSSTIWDESLYYAWSRIVQQIVPDLDLYQKKLEEFCKLSNCDEVVLFEKETFLIIATHDQLKEKSVLQYERVSNIIKQFKLTCMQVSSKIESLKIRNKNFSAIIQEFTKSTYIMVVFRDIQPGAVEFNLKSVQKMFEQNKNERVGLQQKWAQ